jgi:general L-amino acid transport system substrate-binding protein
VASRSSSGSVYGLIEAEEYGHRRRPTSTQLKTESSDPVRACGCSGTVEDTGKLLGLDKEWACRAP